MSSYATEAGADAYFALEYGYPRWASAADKDKALHTATRLLNTLNYAGGKTDDSQVNEFPRDGETDVPQHIKDATCLIAYSLIDGIEPETELQSINTTAFKYGQVSDSKDTDFIPEYRTHGIPNAQAWMMIQPYLRDGNLINILRST